LRATSTDHAPWYVVPANRKWYRNLVVAETIVEAMTDLKLKQPPEPKGVDFSKLRIV
jgi:polyphosphate kinase 2 (PPK2 family)